MKSTDLNKQCLLILAAMKKIGKPATFYAVQKETGMSYSTVRTWMWRMTSDDNPLIVHETVERGFCDCEMWSLSKKRQANI